MKSPTHIKQYWLIIIMITTHLYGFLLLMNQYKLKSKTQTHSYILKLTLNNNHKNAMQTIRIQLKIYICMCKNVIFSSFNASRRKFIFRNDSIIN